MDIDFLKKLFESTKFTLSPTAMFKGFPIIYFKIKISFSWKEKKNKEGGKNIDMLLVSELKWASHISKKCTISQ